MPVERRGRSTGTVDVLARQMSQYPLNVPPPKTEL